MRTLLLLSFFSILCACTCKKNGPDHDEESKVFYTHTEFSMGADLSYVNQIIDRGGVYRDSLLGIGLDIFSNEGFVGNRVGLGLQHPF